MNVPYRLAQTNVNVAAMLCIASSCQQPSSWFLNAYEPFPDCTISGHLLIKPGKMTEKESSEPDGEIICLSLSNVRGIVICVVQYVNEDDRIDFLQPHPSRRSRYVSLAV